MMPTYPAWVTGLLGPSAHDIIDVVPGALRSANERAQNAQAASQLRQLNPYGNTLWLTVHDELSAAIGGLDGCSVVRPAGVSYDLPVCGETVIYAYRQDTRMRGELKDAAMEPKRIREALLALPQREGTEQALDFSRMQDEEDWSVLDRPRVQVRPKRALFVPFVANVGSGLVAAGIGEGMLRRDGTADWVHFETLNLDLYRAAPRAVLDPVAEPRFDNALLPEPLLQPRTRPVEADEDRDREGDLRRSSGDATHA